MRLLLEKKFKYRKTELHRASLIGDEVMIRLLLEKGADFEVRSKNGSTALHIAALEGHDNVVRLLTPISNS